MDQKTDDELTDLLDVMDCLVATARALSAIANTLPKEQKEVILQQADLINKTLETLLQRMKRRVREEKARLHG